MVAQNQEEEFNVLKIADPAVQDFVLSHENNDENEILLKNKTILGLPSRIVIDQIAARRKAREKIPLWYNTKNVIYPPAINLEQSSSQATAIYKSRVVKKECSSFKNGVDLTGGFGIDTFFLCQIFERFQYVEQNIRLLEVVQHNHKLLNSNINISYNALSAEMFIELTKENFDFIYLDPSRRNESAKKVFHLSDCSPDITGIQEKLFKISRFVLLKASPLLDIRQGIRAIKNVKKVFVVSVSNECKELLFFSENNFTDKISIETVNLNTSGDLVDLFSFFLDEEKEVISSFSDPLSYLYEPNPSIMKSGAFKLAGARYGLQKLHANTHLYTSEQVVADFPGRVFKIIKINPNSDYIKQSILQGKANVMVRNYPLAAEELKKKWRLKDGGDHFLIGFTGHKRKHIVLASRVK